MNHYYLSMLILSFCSPTEITCEQERNIRNRDQAALTDKSQYKSVVICGETKPAIFMLIVNALFFKFKLTIFTHSKQQKFKLS